jgi:pyrimidine-nucleoside phosphorylase
MVFAHGGNLDGLNNPRLHKPKFRKEIFAKEDGFIGKMDTLQLGQAVVQLGGGRIQKNDKIDYSTGIRFHKKIGDSVNKGEPLMEIFCSDSERLKMGSKKVKGIIQIRGDKTINYPLILA